MIVYVYLLHGRCKISIVTSTFILNAVKTKYLPYKLSVFCILLLGSNKSHAAQDNGTRRPAKTTQKSEQTKNYWTPNKVSLLLLLFHDSCTIFCSAQSSLEGGVYGKGDRLVEKMGVDAWTCSCDKCSVA